MKEDDIIKTNLFPSMASKTCMPKKMMYYLYSYRISMLSIDYLRVNYYFYIQRKSLLSRKLYDLVTRVLFTKSCAFHIKDESRM